MKIGVFVGSFDPVHIGHERIMKYLVNEKIVDKLLVIPTNNYWNKQNITDLNKRLDMLSFIKTDNIIIDNKHNNKEFTYQILNDLKRKYPNDKFYLIIGADNANTLYKWKNYEEIIKNNLIVIKRDNIKVKNDIPNLIFINKKFSDISSSKIRSNLNKYKNYLDKNVYEYIIKNNLYML